MIGYLFLFFAAWFACGIGGNPGNLLSSDSATHNLNMAIHAAVIGMFFLVPGWICLFLGQHKMLQAIQSEKNTSSK